MAGQASTAAQPNSAPPQYSRDGWWYWDGRAWRPAFTSDGRWKWGAGGWVPLGAERTSWSPERRSLPFSLLFGLLVLDLVGFVPGVPVLTSLAAAATLLVIDARGLVTLNGMIRWRRLSGGQRLFLLFAEIVFFQFVVAIYVLQSMYGLAKAGARRAPASRTAGGDSTVQAGSDARSSAAAIDPDGIQQALENLLSDSKSRLPRDLFEKVQGVAAAIRELLPAYRDSALDPHDRFLVVRTAIDYLPSAVQSYLRVPAAYRSVSLPDADGQTAGEVLSDQLDLLLSSMREVANRTFRKDVEALLIHRRFLQSKFGRSSLSVDSRD